MHMNLGNFDEPELDDGKLSQELDEKVDDFGEYVPGLDV